MAERIRVEVAYAHAHEQVILELEVDSGTTVVEAIRQSGITARFPEIDLATNKVGVFGKLAALDRRLRADERVEIYRPLPADPKELRRRRASAVSGAPARPRRGK